MRGFLLLLQKIILYSLYKIRDERTINAIYHLLTGKQSIQTIQDAHLFHLGRFFALYKQLQIGEFKKQLVSLTEHNYIDKIEENQFTLTTKGLQLVNEYTDDTYYWNGMKFHQIDELFMQRLFLIIQVWTNRQAGINRYIPIVEDVKVTAWVKRFYRQQGSNVSEHLRQLYEELIQLFEELPEVYPNLFIKQITTNRSIGLTDDQLASKYKRSSSHIYLMYKNYVHYMLRKIKETTNQYPLLQLLIEDLHNVHQKTTITNSAKMTEAFVKRGLSPNQIAAKRRLKVTTIYDHIVEIALHDQQFPMERFVSKEMQREVYEAVVRLNSFKLKNIKETISEEISYFQIRLALTRINTLITGDQNG